MIKITIISVIRRYIAKINTIMKEGNINKAEILFIRIGVCGKI